MRLTLSTWQASGIEDDALLITSELVTNAVTTTERLTAQAPCGERARLSLITTRVIGLHDSVIIEVVDVSAECPVLGRLRSDAEGGRGLYLVQQLSTRWGSYPAEAGKVMWAELTVCGP
ncbi:ATP-binding protein [Streptomyces sp. NBC_01754]|uniref:ATP-binding protein n=1 Tax=Streptomyces sp. NBC_01754 TaxID=2975930 RepID=UPI002DDA1DA7|nr:ATP-binding protein [Streptomyces sp. NBC_01754]WSC94872.1 ATP-binding protein [Streptomyces sp. NBC_01754]